MSLTTLTSLKAIELEMFHGNIIELTPLVNLKSLRVLGAGPVIRALTNLERLTALHALFLDTPGCEFHGVARLTGLTYLTLRPVTSPPMYLKNLTLLGELNIVGYKNNGNPNNNFPNLADYFTHLHHLRLISLWNFRPFSLQPFARLSSLIGLALGDIDNLPKEEAAEILRGASRLRAIKITRCKGLPEITATTRAQVDGYLTNLENLEVYTGPAGNSNTTHQQIGNTANNVINNTEINEDETYDHGIN